MKNLSVYLFLILFTLQAPSLADDISDFQIEGMSIGDRALNYFSEEKIKSSKQKTQYPNDKFIVYQLERIKTLDVYEGMNVSIKKNDKKYIVSHIQAGIYYEEVNEFKKCNSDMKKILVGIFDIVKNLTKIEQKYLSKFDNKSPVWGTEFYFDNGEAIVVNCNDWRKETGLTKTLDVMIATEEFVNFIINEAYK